VSIRGSAGRLEWGRGFRRWAQRGARTRPPAAGRTKPAQRAVKSSDAGGRAARLARFYEGNVRSRDVALQQHFAAEAIHARGPPARCMRGTAGFFHQILLGNEAPKVLFMGALARDRLDDGLQLTQGEFLGHEFKNDRPVLTFCAQPGDAGGDNAPVIKSHRPPQAPTRAFSSSLRFGDKSRLIEKFIALQDQIGHPWEVLEAKISLAALAARLAGFRIGR